MPNANCNHCVSGISLVLLTCDSSFMNSDKGNGRTVYLFNNSQNQCLNELRWLGHRLVLSSANRHWIYIILGTELYIRMALFPKFSFVTLTSVFKEHMLTCRGSGLASGPEVPTKLLVTV